jgi:hypothetical protein
MTTSRTKRGAARASAAVVVVAVLAAGCVGHTPHGAIAPQPKLRRVLAHQLAALSDAVAGKLDRGNACGALRTANTLKSRATAAVDGGEVPRKLQGPLTAATTALVTKIECVPPVSRPSSATPPARPHHKGHDKGKHKGHGGEGD